MEKKQAVKVISDAAKIYDKFYCNKNLLIIFGSPNKPLYIEIKADEKNFAHLTGVKLNNSLLKDIQDKNSNILDIFYQKAKQNRLSVNDFDFKNNSTVQKMQVLVRTLKISANMKMVGDYSGNRINLKTDKIAGSVNSFLGFLKTGKFYTPNTVIAEDIRKNTGEVMKVLAVFSKNINDKEYNSIEAVGKKIDIERLIEKISQSVPIGSKLIGDKEQNHLQTSTPPPTNIKQIKFNTPVPQSIIYNNGVGAAVLSASNPFQGLIGRIKDGIKNLFTPNTEKQDKPDNTHREKEPQEESKPVEEDNSSTVPPIPKEMTELIDAREAFAEKKIDQDEYKQVITQYMHSLHGKEQWEAAVEQLAKQLDQAPVNRRGLIDFELKSVQHNFDKRFASKTEPPRQTLDEIKRSAHEKYIKQQDKKAVSPAQEYNDKDHFDYQSSHTRQ